MTDVTERNVIGAHAGAYSVYRALAVAAGQLCRRRTARTSPTPRPPVPIGPFPQWSDPRRHRVSMDPWGHLAAQAFAAGDRGRAGHPAQHRRSPSAHIAMPEIARRASRAGSASCRMATVLSRRPAMSVVTKIAIEPVWHLPGIARRFGIPMCGGLRRALFEQYRRACFPNWSPGRTSTCSCRPIGGSDRCICSATPAKLGRLETRIACRIHDECNGSDVFGSDICTCRPYLAQGIEVCVETAQQAGGVGVVVYNRKEGRALGEVTKFLVYNARKRQEGGDPRRGLFRAHRVRGRA